jgi:hypothetical protein
MTWIYQLNEPSCFNYNLMQAKVRKFALTYTHTERFTVVTRVEEHMKHGAIAGRKLIRMCSELAQFPFYASKLKITANTKPKRTENLSVIMLAVHLFRTEYLTC